jgi:hypothetical protein
LRGRSREPHATTSTFRIFPPEKLSADSKCGRQ